MCSPKIRLSEETLKNTHCFKDLLLEDVLQNFGMDKLPVYDKRSKVYKAFTIIKETEFKYVKVVRYKGTYTYLLDMPSFRILQVGRNCRDLAKIADKILLQNGKEPVNIFKRSC